MHGYFLKQICLHLKKYSQNGNLPQVGVNIMNITKYLKPPPRNQLWTVLWNTFQHLEPRHFHPKSLPVVFWGFRYLHQNSTRTNGAISHFQSISSWQSTSCENQKTFFDSLHVQKAIFLMMSFEASLWDHWRKTMKNNYLKNIFVSSEIFLIFFGIENKKHKSKKKSQLPKKNTYGEQWENPSRAGLELTRPGSPPPPSQRHLRLRKMALGSSPTVAGIGLVDGSGWVWKALPNLSQNFMGFSWRKKLGGWKTSHKQDSYQMLVSLRVMNPMVVKKSP